MVLWEDTNRLQQLNGSQSFWWQDSFSHLEINEHQKKAFVWMGIY